MSIKASPASAPAPNDRFSRFIASGAPALLEGAIVERLRRDGVTALDRHIVNGGLIYDPSARDRLAALHRDYFAAAAGCGTPLLAFTDSWRCSAARIAASPFRDRPVNQDNVQFMKALREDFVGAAPIFIGGLVGPSGDAYRPADSLSRAQAREFHRPQIQALASASVDFLFLATAPAVEEALGVADAMSETALPYVISFVIRRSGHVLDGEALGAAIERIDALAVRRPLGFAVNCVHAHVLDQALAATRASHPDALGRLLMFQANTADCEVEALDNAEELIGEEPGLFAETVAKLGRAYDLRRLGGCCGSNGAHIDALARLLSDSRSRFDCSVAINGPVST